MTTGMQTDPPEPDAPALGTGGRNHPRDLPGAMDVPADAYRSVHTPRAVDLPITGVPVDHVPGFVEALGLSNQAAGRAHRHLRHLSVERADTIDRARDLIEWEGCYHDQFPQPQTSLH